MLNGFQSHERLWMVESVFPVEVAAACFAYARDAKSFRLIGSVLTANIDVEARVRSLHGRESNPVVRKKLEHALKRFERAAKTHGVE